MNIRLARDQVVLFQTAKNLWTSRSKANYFFAGFSSFEFGGLAKHSPRETLGVWGKQNSLVPLGPVIKCLLLYLPKKILFPIGGKRVTCRGLKLTNSPGKQQLELWTRTWSGCAPLNRGKFVHRLMLKSHWSRITFLIRDKKRDFIVTKTYQINTRENMNVLCP